jgi:hypothetical protein
LYEGYVRSHTHELKIAWGKATYVRPFWTLGHFMSLDDVV